MLPPLPDTCGTNITPSLLKVYRREVESLKSDSPSQLNKLKEVASYLFSSSEELRECLPRIRTTRPGTATPEEVVEMMLDMLGRRWGRGQRDGSSVLHFASDKKAGT